MTEWKDSHDQYLDEWVSFPYEIKRYQEWLPVYTPFPDTGDVLAQEMLDVIEGKLANLEEYLAQIIYYLGELQKRLNAIEYYMTKAANQMEAYLDSTKVLEIEQIHGVSASLIIGPTYNDLNNIDTATLTDWRMIGESNFNFVDSDNLGGNYPAGVWGDGNFIYVGNHSNEIITYSVDGSGTLTHESTNNQVTYSGKIWGDGNFLYVAGSSDGIYSFSVNGSGVLTYIDHHDPGDITHNIWGDGNFIYTTTYYPWQFDGKIHSYSVDGSGNLTHIDSHTLNHGQCKGIWGDGNFIYTNQGNYLCSYSVDGSGNLTLIDNLYANPGSIEMIYGDNNFIYAVGYGIYSFSADGFGNLTQIDYRNPGGMGKDIYADNNYIYMATEYAGLNVYSVDGSGNFNYEYSHDPPGTQNYYGIWADNNFIYTVIYTSPGKIYIYSKPSVQTLYEYEGIGWDNDPIIIKYIADWDFGKDYLIHPLITFDGDYGIYPNIDIFTKAKTTIEGTKDKITDSEEVLEYYI